MSLFNYLLNLESSKYTEAPGLQQKRLAFFFPRFLGWSLLLQLAVWVCNLLPSVAATIQHSIAVFAGNIYHLYSDNWLAVGNILIHTDSHLFVMIGQQCTGLSLTATLLAAVLSLPNSFKSKFIVAVAIIVLIQFENTLRIAHLFFLVSQENNSFNFYHFYVWQAVNFLTASMLIYFIFSHIDLPRG